MKKIQLWSVESDNSGKLNAVALDTAENTDTEETLEDLLVRCPSLLVDKLTLVGRQVPTEGGSLDLLGIDEDGRLVLFELKRGTLTRDAVAQILDYASDLAGIEVDRLGKLIEDYSGRLGVDKVDDFADWYAQRFPNSSGPLSETPKMMLVGLGVDDRARRIVNFLANSSVDIELLTFHAFTRAEKLFLARQAETVSPVTRPPREQSGAPTKEGNLRILRENAASLGVTPFFDAVADFLSDNLPAYRWPGKTAYSFYLAETTEEGKPTQRAYATLYLNQKSPGALNLIFFARALQAAGSAAENFRQKLPNIVTENKRYNQFEVRLVPDQWDHLSKELKEFLAALLSGWKSKATERTDLATHEGNSSG